MEERKILSCVKMLASERTENYLASRGIDYRGIWSEKPNNSVWFKDQPEKIYNDNFRYLLREARLLLKEEDVKTESKLAEKIKLIINRSK